MDMRVHAGVPIAEAGIKPPGKVERHPFQHRPGKFSLAVRHGQAHQCAAGLRVPVWTALAHQVRQEQKAVRSGRYAGRLRVHALQG